MKIRIRDDDVLILGKAYTSYAASLEKFKLVHNICLQYNVCHVPALLCGNLNEFPEAVDFLNREFKEGRLELQLHGWEHVDYGTFTEEELRSNFSKCHEWFYSKFKTVPTIFYVPWNGYDDLIDKVSNEFKMKTRGSNVEKIEPWYITGSPDKYIDRDEIEILFHWWWGNRYLISPLEFLAGKKVI